MKSSLRWPSVEYSTYKQHDLFCWFNYINPMLYQHLEGFKFVGIISIDLTLDGPTFDILRLSMPR